MKLTSHKFKALFDLIATEWADCSPHLAMARVGDDLPEIPTIYILSNEAHDILYIGQTKHLAIRMAQHSANSRILIKMKNWTRIYWMMPGIKNLHKRVMIEASLAIPCVPKANQAFMLKHNKNDTWSEIRFRRRRRF